MGRAARWLRELLCGKKADSGGEHRTEKKKWSFIKSFREKGRQQQQQQTEGPPSPRRARIEEVARSSLAGATAGLVDVDGDEQNKRALAVAAANAAVAEAAVAASQAAATVVRLTSSGLSVAGFAAGAGMREEAAAIKIQAAFRGCLARRTLKALKGLVKLQALVRGNIVRKRGAEMLRCMQALVRVQARARASRALRSEMSRSSRGSRAHACPPTPEKFIQAVRSSGSKSERSCILKRNPSKPASIRAVHSDRTRSSGWNWSYRWMEEHYWDSGESAAKAGAAMDGETNEKILEVEPGKPQFNPKRRGSNPEPSCSTLASDQNKRSFAAMPDWPSKDSSTTQLSIPSPYSGYMLPSLSLLRFPFGQSPQFYSAMSQLHCEYPNYIASMESSRAMVQAPGVPKKRPEFEKPGSIRRLLGRGFRRQHFRASAQRSSSSLHGKFANETYPRMVCLDRLEMPIRI